MQQCCKDKYRKFVCGMIFCCIFVLSITIKKNKMTNLTQKKAHTILVKNNHFCGGKIPFNKTSDYVGMLLQTNQHRRIWNAKELK